MSKAKVSIDSIGFTVSAEWPEADVDVVITRLNTFAEPIIADSRTPTEASVSRMLDALHDDEQLKSEGIKPDSWCEFMMGCCSMTFTMDASKAHELPQLLSLAKSRMRAAIRQHVKYYQNGTTVSPGRVAVIG